MKMKQLIKSLSVTLLTTSALFSHPDPIPDPNHIPKVFIRSIENETEYPLEFVMENKVIAQVSPHKPMPSPYYNQRISIPLEKVLDIPVSAELRYKSPPITIRNAGTKKVMYEWLFRRSVDKTINQQNYVAEIFRGAEVIASEATSFSHGTKDNYNLEVYLKGDNLQDTYFDIIPYLE